MPCAVNTAANSATGGGIAAGSPVTSIVNAAGVTRVSSGSTLKTAASIAGEPTPRGSTSRRAFDAAGKLASTMANSSPWPMLASACSRSGDNSGSMPFNMPSTSLDAARGHTGQDFLLDHDREQQDRKRHDNGRRGERAPRQLLEGQHVVDGDRQRSRLAAGQHRAEDEVVPREDEGKDEADDDAGPREGQGDVTERRPDARAVDLPRLLELARLRFEMPGHDIDDDRHGDDEMGENQRVQRVVEVQELEN